MAFFDKILPRRRRDRGPADLQVNEQTEGPKPQKIDGDRGIPSVSKKRKMPAAVRFAMLTIVAGTIGFLAFVNHNPSSSGDKKEKAKEPAKNDRVENRLPPLNFNEVFPAKKPDTESPPKSNIPNVAGTGNPGAGNKAAQPIGVIPTGKGGQSAVPNVAGTGPAAAPPGAVGGPGGKPIKTPEERWKERRMGGNLVAIEGGETRPAAGGAGAEDSAAPATPFLGPQMGGGKGEDLGDKLRTVSTPDARAMTLFDRNYLLAKGSTIDCTLETRLVSTVPGMVRCVASHDIYSDNGNVLLMERGTVFTGTQQGGIKQGQARIFALWERAKTPKGVVINLASPGADPLGGSGLPGYVDSHFMERFGGAILMSIVMDVTDQHLANNGSNTNTYQNTTNAGRDAVTEALRNSINIPPTLYKNQGESIMIYVARDLDFRTVYSLEATQKGAGKVVRK